MTAHDSYPQISDLGLTAKLVTFAPAFSDAGNRAALAFRAVIAQQEWDGIEETATSLVSTFIRFNPLKLPHNELEARLGALLGKHAWEKAALPGGRKLWTIPVAIGGEHGPQFEEASELAGLSLNEARSEILASRNRVLTLGFAPGQPYMGELDPHWDIPRMSELNPEVSGGALVTAIRQLIIFAGPAPTGWRQVGRTAFQCFRPDTDTPIPLTAGDEVTYRPVTSEELEEIKQHDQTGDGGATWELVP